LSREDRWLLGASALCAALAGGAVLVVVAYVAHQALPLLSRVGAGAFLHVAWAPTAGRYGLLAMAVGTASTTLGALCLAAPLGVAYAAVTAFWASPRIAGALSSLAGLLAGVPSVVFGLWGIAVLSPRVAAHRPPGLCVLTAVLVLAVMCVPTVAALSTAAFRQVPRSLLQAAAALGLGRTATLWKVCLPAARRGVATAVLLVAGNTVQVPHGPFDAARTLTANVALEMAYALGDHHRALFVTGLALLGLVGPLVALGGIVAHARDR
jgi:phosphate transport system permease protein